MDLLAAIRERRSIRRYARQEVPAETVERLLAAATWAPSAHNRQPWRFAVIVTDSVKATLAQAMAERLRADRLADGDPPARVEADAARSYARLTGAPVVVAACLSMQDMDRYSDSRRSQAERLMAVQSVALAVQNLLLTAHAEGLGACWLCAPLFCAAAVQAALKLPPGWEPQALITLGYPADSGKETSRTPVGAVTLWR